MTKEFDKRNMAKSRRVCEDMEAAHVTKWLKLTERERQILDMWPKFEDGQYVWFGDEAIDNKGGTRSVVHFGISEHTSCVTDETLLGADRPTGAPFKRSGQSASDSWERLEEDAEFNDEIGVVGGNLDIVRRAKALAGIEVV